MNSTTGDLCENICLECRQIFFFDDDNRSHYCMQKTDGGSISSLVTFPDYGVRRDYSKVIGRIEWYE